MNVSGLTTRWLYQGDMSPPPVTDPDAPPYLDEMFQARPEQLVAESASPNYLYRFEPPLPSLFTIFDAFELNAWDSSQAISATSNNSIRVNAAGQGQGGGQDQGKGKGGSGSKGKLKKYGQFAWPLGMSMPYVIGDFPLGPGGEPPDFEGDEVFTEMYWQDFHRKRPVQRPFERELIDTLPDRQRIDWETPFGHNMHRSRLTWQDYSMERVEFPDEQITLDKWFQRLSEPVRVAPPSPLPPLARYYEAIDTEEDVFVDKWDNPLMRPLPQLTPKIVPPWPFDQPPEDILEQITLDKWYSRLSEPMRLVPWRQPPLGVMDPEPIPDPPLLPTAIPWYVPLALPTILPPAAIPPLETFVNDTGEEEVAPFVDKWAARAPDLIPRPLNLPISLFPFRLEPEIVDPENITLDKWYSPLSYNFHRLVPQTPPMETYPVDQDLEQITLDKWYSNTGFWAWPFYALRHATGPEAQRSDLLVNTAPWIEMQRMDPFPLPDIPGVTYAYWFTPLSLPVELFTAIEENDERHLRLYLPLQDFPLPPSRVLECESPRRRVAQKQNPTCGSGHVR